MTTRGSLARGQGQQQFQGNVQKWVRQWVEPGTGPGSSKVALPKWVPTGDRSGSKPGPRFPHLQPVSNANLKVPAGKLKDNGKKPIARQHEPSLSQPAAMDIDGGQLAGASKPQQEGSQAAEVHASRARDTNGEPHNAPEHPGKQRATELPDQEAPTISQHAGRAHESKAVPEVGRSLADVAAEPIQTSNSHADTEPPGTSAPAVDVALQQPAPASWLDPHTQQQEPRQDNAHGSTKDLQPATASVSGGNTDEKLPLPGSIREETPGQAPAGKDDEALIEGKAPDQAMAAARDAMLAGGQAPSEGPDEVLTGPGPPSGVPDQAPISIAAETAASAAAVDDAEQLQLLAEGAPFESRSLDEQRQINSEPAVAALAPAKRPAEGVDEGKEPDAKRARAEPGSDLPG